MRSFLVLLLTSLLAGCVTSSPQKTLFKAEYPQRLDIRQHSVYQFKTRPIASSGESYRGSGDLAELFRVSNKDASMLQLRFDYPKKSFEVVSLDAHNTILDKHIFSLLDESASGSSGSEGEYFYLTKDGQLMQKTRNCTPDMSVGCQWRIHNLFITRNGDMAVHYENGSAVVLFLLLPAYGSREYLEIFSKVSPLSDVTASVAPF